MGINLDQTVVNVATTTTPVLARDKDRKYGLFINDSDTVIYLSFENDAALHQGIRLNPNGGSFEMSELYGNLSGDKVNAINAGSGTKKLLVVEG